jgi:alkylation response protein AidB-like acyl-CoA dehydrogenase
VAFRLAHEDAVALANQSVPSVEDFEGLPVFNAYAQLVVGGSVGRWLSLRTRKMSAPTSDPQILRTHSREKYGRERSTIDAAIREIYEGTGQLQENDIGRRRRPKGSS